MSDPNVKWTPQQLRVQVNNGLDKNLSAAGVVLRDRAKVLVSTQGAVVVASDRAVGLKKRVKIRGKIRSKQLRLPSLPGEPPHRWTGRLRRGIKSKLKKGKQSVRVSAVGGNLTEFGTKNMAARPFLRPALAQTKGTIAELLVQPVKQ